MEELRHSCSDSLAVRHPGSGLATLKQGGGGVMPRLLRSVFKLFKLGRLDYTVKITKISQNQYDIHQPKIA